jgi:hypothetical protein
MAEDFVGRYTSAIMTLAFLRRPAVSLGAGIAHQHRTLALAQAVGETEGLDGLFVVDDREGAGPVGAPQAAVEAPGIEHTGERVPDVWEGIGFLGQRAGAADLDHHVRALGQLAWQQAAMNRRMELTAAVLPK